MLQLQDGTTNLGTVTNTFSLGACEVPGFGDLQQRWRRRGDPHMTAR